MLTNISVRALRPQDKAYKVTDGDGLYILVQPTGALYWRMDFSYAKKRKTLALGVYPKVSLKMARDKRARARELLEQGIDPSIYRQMTRGVSNLSMGDNFQSVAEEWVSKIEKEGRSPNTIDKIRWLLRFTEPFLGKRPISLITAPELLTVLRSLEARGRYETARRLRSTCGSVLAIRYQTRASGSLRAGEL